MRVWRVRCRLLYTWCHLRTSNRPRKQASSQAWNFFLSFWTHQQRCVFMIRIHDDFLWSMLRNSTLCHHSISSSWPRTPIHTKGHHSILQHCSSTGCQSWLAVPAQGSDTLLKASSRLLYSQHSWYAGELLHLYLHVGVCRTRCWEL